jgi:hypothetical protein
MKIAIIKSKLQIIKTKLLEFRNEREVRFQKPEFERLFADFKEISNQLKQVNADVFDELSSKISSQTESARSASGNHYTRYTKTCLETLLYEVEKAIGFIYVLENESTSDSIESNPLSVLNIISDGFHKAVRQIRKRYSNRSTLNVTDEYDVQDFYHSLLRIFFDDIREETYIPKYAGGNSRIDFLLKSEGVGIEIKKSRESLKAKELGEQLIIDIERYGSYSDIDSLYCFVYDPEGWIENPRGLENDLSGTKNNLNVIVRIEPK